MAEKLTPGTTTTNGLVAESDFMYEAPGTEPTFDLKSAEDDFIKSYLSGNEPADPETFEQDPDMFGDGQDPVDEMVEEQAPAEEPKVQSEPDDEVDDPKLARGIQRVVQRELAAKAEREAADRSIAELRALKEEVSKYKDLKSTAELSQMMDIDPLGAIKALGKDPDTLIKLALAQQLGDSAPASLKEFAREAGTKREIAQLKAQLAQEAQARAAQEYFNTIHAGAREYATSFGDPKTPKSVVDSMPTLALVAKADPDYARDEIMEEIVAEAKRVAATDPNGEPLSYAEAAKRVETRFARLAKLLKSPNGTNPATKNVMKPRGNTPPAVKPPAKPLAPWQRNADSIEEQGLAEALRVYEQAEAARKQRR